MGFKIRHIAVRFVLILVGAAVLPLIAFGIASLLSLRTGTRASVIAGNQNVATRAADEIERYISSHAEILKSLATEIQDIGLTESQEGYLLRSAILQFREFSEFTKFDGERRPIVSSRVGPPRTQIPDKTALTFNGVTMSPVRI